MSYAEIENQITSMETKLKDTKGWAEGDRSAVNSALLIVIPMLEDQLRLMRLILAQTKPNPN